MKNYMLLSIAICLLSCEDEQGGRTVAHNVYLAGYLANSNMDGDYVASYWKDGAYAALTTDGSKSQVSSLSVDGSMILIGGFKRTAGVFPEATIWKDGVERKIDGAIGGPMMALQGGSVYGVWQTSSAAWVYDKDGTSRTLADTAYNYAPMAMTVSGADIYAAGYSSPRPSPPDWFSPQHAQCWKNGQLIFRESEYSNALSIVVHDDDVYLAGVKYSADLTTPGIACYWKNGERIDLSDPVKNAIARSIFVTDSHVYVAGMMDDQAVYWRDGELVELTQGEFQSIANCIYVHEPDVYVAGHEVGYPAFWKNDVKESIGNGNIRGQVKFISVNGD